MSPRRTLLLALLVVTAGCTGTTAPGEEGETTTTTETTVGTPTTTSPTTDATTADTTTPDTTEPHTAQGTSHAGSHLSVRASYGVENVTVTLAPEGETATFGVDGGAERSFTREIHDRGHDVQVVVERGSEVVFDQVIRDYQYYQLTVYENETSVTQSVV